MEEKKRICITNRHLVTGDYYKQMEKVFALHPDLVVVREKDLEENEYYLLAKKLLEMGKKYGVEVCLHKYADDAMRLGCRRIHLPLAELFELNQTEEGKKLLSFFSNIGTSVHSMEEKNLAESCGATYLFAGHIFETDCKKGLPGRGLSFLKEICESTDLPVYAIGGIKEENQMLCYENGAAGVCQMSEYMKL